MIEQMAIAGVVWSVGMGVKLYVECNKEEKEDSSLDKFEGILKKGECSADNILKRDCVINRKITRLHDFEMYKGVEEDE